MQEKRKMYKYLSVIILLVILTGCYTDTINKLETFSIQLPVTFNAPFVDRSAPDTSVDFSNLYQYPEYDEYKDRISKAEILQVNYRIDSLVYEDGTVFDKNTHDLEFDFIRYSFQFAKPKPGKSIYSTDPNDFEPDLELERVTLGEFRDVLIRDYFREAKMILDVPSEIGRFLSDGLRTRPYFFVYTEYSKVKGQTEDEFGFQLIKANFDLILRLEVKL